jgi:hypothetical protein
MNDDVKKFLKDLNINPNTYLKNVRKNAHLLNIKPSYIFFSDLKPYKLMYYDGQNKLYFGRVPYHDVIIYRLLGDPKAETHKINYHKRMFKDVDFDDNIITPKKLTLLNWI